MCNAPIPSLSDRSFGRKMEIAAIRMVYRRYKVEYFTKLSEEDPAVPPEDKQEIKEQYKLSAPWVKLSAPTSRRAHTNVTGDNIYLAWWTNNTFNNNDEINFRASTDGGQTFGDKINLSNTTDFDSSNVEIGSEGDSVVVTWWETNQTGETPLMRVSNDNGATFGPNGTVGEVAEEESEDGE